MKSRYNENVTFSNGSMILNGGLIANNYQVGVEEISEVFHDVGCSKLVPSNAVQDVRVEKSFEGINTNEFVEKLVRWRMRQIFR